VYKFLAKHYVESRDKTLRFNYDKDFLRWALTVPGQYDNWVVGVRTKLKDSKKEGEKAVKGAMCGFITAIPVHLMVSLPLF
jgi:glycylpeptide N-tetradecanoyltransferase